jgi:hypothetical protein
MSRRRTSPMALMHNQRALTELAGERIAELLHWRSADLDFAVVVWSRREGEKATTYVSRNDPELAVKLSGLIGDHASPGDTTT